MEILTVIWHLLTVVEVVLLLILATRLTSDSCLIVCYPRSMPPPLALPHGLLARINELLLMLALVSMAHLLLPMSTYWHLLLTPIDMLLVARTCLNVVQLLVYEVKLSTVVVNVLFLIDLMAAIYYLLFDQVSAFS